MGLILAKLWSFFGNEGKEVIHLSDIAIFSSSFFGLLEFFIKKVKIILSPWDHQSTLHL